MGTFSRDKLQRAATVRLHRFFLNFALPLLEPINERLVEISLLACLLLLSLEEKFPNKFSSLFFFSEAKVY